MTPSDAIKFLLARGMTETAIGDAIGSRQSTINRIKTGDMVPNWATGTALIDLARRFAAESEQEEGTDPALKDAA